MTTTSTVSTTQIEFTWNIAGVVAGSDDVVTRVYWTYNADIRQVDSDHIYHDGLTGWINLTVGDTVIPYDQLTKQEMIDWVINSLGTVKIAELETQLTQMIDDQKNNIHDVEFRAPPWI